jgi:NhaA family Na+:H+ antiporter
MSNRNLNPLSLEALAQSVMQPFQRFFKREASGGLLLILVSIAAVLIANSAAGGTYQNFWKTTFGVTLGGSVLIKDLHHWINEGLMAVFFFVVGLEIKRELLTGELSSVKQASLPIAAAMGGMVVPAAIYAYINFGGVGQGGWGIPMATDIAFALGCLSLLGRRVAIQLVVFLTAIAIVDDIGAILVIALFYTEELSLSSIVAGAVFLAISFIFNRMGIRKTFPYALIGVGMWLVMLDSGIHATVAGILLAMTIPSSTSLSLGEFVDKIREQLLFMTGNKDGQITCPIGVDEEGKQTIIQSIEHACFEAEAPLDHLEHLLHPWAVFLIIPLFAFANAGVEIGLSGIGTVVKEPVFLGVLLGLVFGKQAGVFLFSWLAVKAGIARLPMGVNWWHIYGVSLLAGVGFTMSLFIGTLAFTDPRLLETTKLAIFTASIIAALGGLIVLWLASGKRKRTL